MGTETIGDLVVDGARPPLPTGTRVDSINDRAHLTRTPKACSRCRTKRIKCLGGTPCRNCVLSQTACVFPARKGSRAAMDTTSHILSKDNPSSTIFSGENAVSPPAQYPGYRRPEKQFGCRREAPVPLRTYRGNPSCCTFIEQLIEWTSIQGVYIQDLNVIHFDLGTPWQVMSTISGAESFDLEISVDCQNDTAPSIARRKRPMKLRLPPYDYSIRLIDTVEQFIGQEQHYFLRRTLRNKVLTMHQDPESSENRTQGWLCRWLSVVALGELYSRIQTVQADVATPQLEQEPPGADYYFQAVSLLQELAETPDIEYVETLCLLALYAYSLNKVNTAYMYVGVAMRAALALGLHRDIKDGIVGRSSTSDKVRYEHEKRIFWNVYYLDLMTTSATGRPWGILDGEITVDLPSSLSLDSVEASEFFDATVANAYLDVMRLRSQAYSALYGYAGKDCTPFSNVSFFDHGLDTPLSQAHLDKIHEFHLGLTNWERNNSPALRIAHHSNGAVSNLTRTTGMLYLTYYQCILVILRPVVVQGHNHCFEDQKQALANSVALDHQMNLEEPPPSVKIMCKMSFDIATKMVTILSTMWQLGLLASCAYFEASFTFTAAIALAMAKSMCSSIATGRASRILDKELMDKIQEAMTTSIKILDYQSFSGNVAAAEYRKLLSQLEANLNDLSYGALGL